MQRYIMLSHRRWSPEQWERLITGLYERTLPCPCCRGTGVHFIFHPTIPFVMVGMRECDLCWDGRILGWHNN